MCGIQLGPFVPSHKVLITGNVKYFCLDRSLSRDKHAPSHWVQVFVEYKGNEYHILELSPDKHLYETDALVNVLFTIMGKTPIMGNIYLSSIHLFVQFFFYLTFLKGYLALIFLND